MSAPTTGGAPDRVVIVGASAAGLAGKITTPTLPTPGRLCGAESSVRPYSPLRRARETQLCSTPGWMPGSSATSGIGFPVSVTIRTGPSRNSAS